MTSSRHRGAAAGYSRVRNESRTQQSTPEGLILLVFESLLDRLVKCQWHLDRGSDSDFDREILKSMQLIQYGLRDSLALESGGEVALGLDHTYSVWMLALDWQSQ
jgi:flagellar protein FliS